MYTATLCGKIIGPRGKALKPVLKSHGYHTFSQSDGAGNPNQTYVHRFVFEFFNGPVPEGLVVDHIDGDRTNNSLHNLQAITNRENIMKGKLGKLTQEDVDAIRNMLGTKTQRAIAKQFGVSEQLICDIKKGRRYD